MKLRAIPTALILLWLALQVPTPVRPALAQEADARELSASDSRALEAWARELLKEVEELEESASPTSLHLDVQRLWALYFLSVEHSSRVDDARDLAAALMDPEALPPTLQGTAESLAGAVEVVRAKHSRWPPNKLKYLKAGMEVLDGGVAREPESAVTRYLRLVSYYYLPFFLDREETVAQDFEALARLLPAGSDSMPAAVYRAAVEFVLEKGDLEQDVRRQLQGALR